MAQPDPTVFVVDDDSAIRDSLRWLLESAGLQVETYSTGEEFLRSCDLARSGCVVLDVRMPGMDGLTLGGELHARQIPWPVIIITGYPDVATVRRAFDLGALAFLEKPLDDELLLDNVAQALEADRRTRQPGPA